MKGQMVGDTNKRGEGEEPFSSSHGWNAVRIVLEAATDQHVINTTCIYVKAIHLFIAHCSHLKDKPLLPIQNSLIKIRMPAYIYIRKQSSRNLFIPLSCRTRRLRRRFGRALRTKHRIKPVLQPFPRLINPLQGRRAAKQLTTAYAHAHPHAA